MKSKRNCADCIHSYADTRLGGAKMIECRRYPPEPILNEHGASIGYNFPIVYPETWCSEFSLFSQASRPRGKRR